MVTIVDKLAQLTKDLEKVWTKAIKDIERRDEYSRSTVVRFAGVEMNRLIRRALDMDSIEFQRSFKSGSPESYFDLGAEHFKNQVSKTLFEKGLSLEVNKLWSIFQEKRKKDLRNAKDIVRIRGTEELESINMYMYFSLGLKSILSICREKIQELPSFDFQKEADRAENKLKEIRENLDKMDDDLHKDRGLIYTYNSEIKDIQNKISKICEAEKQLAAEIKGEVDTKMLPELGELERLIRDSNARIRKTREALDEIRKRTEDVESAKDATEQLIKRLEEKYKENLERLYSLAERFLASDDEFLVIHKGIFKTLGENKEALIDCMEYGLDKYKIENANVSERIDSKVADIERKIRSTPLYNSAIPQFWIQVLKHPYGMSYEVTKENRTFKSPVDIEWQKGIEEIISSLNRLFEDKDALRAMRSVNDYEVPLFNDGQEIWDRYQRTDIETRKKLYEIMKSHSTNPTYLQIGIPKILSEAIVKTAVHHRDIAEFIWFCCVAYDEMWKRYGDLLDEMVKRRI